MGVRYAQCLRSPDSWQRTPGSRRMPVPVAAAPSSSSSFYDTFFTNVKQETAPLNEAAVSGMIEGMKHLLDKRFEGSGSSDDLTDFQYNFYQAQLLQAQDMYADSISYLDKAFQKIKLVVTDSRGLYNHMYSSIGSLLATTYDNLNEFDKAEAVYSELLKCDDTLPYIGDYAIFLHRRKRDFKASETYYKKALKLYPQHSTIHLKYAGFLRHVRKDLAGAEEQYKLACESNTFHADAVGSYASFLHGVRNDAASAEKLYESAVSIDSTHSNNLCNYGLFLSEEKGDYTKAESKYKRALEVSPKHANTLYNYAVMLDTHVKRKPEAEVLYRQCVEVEPRHSYALYNLAVLLEESTANWERGERERGVSVSRDLNKEVLLRRREVCSFYKRSVEADGKDPTTLSDCGRYLFSVMDDTEAAYPYFQSALQLDPNNAVSLYNIGVIQFKDRKELMIAETTFRKLLNLAPRHAACMHQLARVLAEKFKSTNSSDSKDGALDECAELYEAAIALQKEPGPTALEYIKLINKLGDNRQRMKVIASMGSLLSAKKTSKDADIRALVEVAKSEL